MATQYVLYENYNCIKFQYLYFIANDVADEKKDPMSLSSIGAPTYTFLSDMDL